MKYFGKSKARISKGDLSVYYWNDEKDLPQILRDAICKELACSDVELPESLKQKIGIDDLKSLESDPAALEKSSDSCSSNKSRMGYISTEFLSSVMGWK